MFNSGFLESDLTNISYIESSREQKVEFPDKYSIVEQLDTPHDQGYRGICVSVCVTDICKHIYQGQGKVWDQDLDFFYNGRSDKSLDGMSPREALEIACNQGFIKSFAFPKNVLDVQKCIFANGPVMVGLPVYSTERPDFWNDYYGTLDLLGYHAVTLVGYDTSGFTLRNSWGTGYGHKGYSVLHYTAFGRITEAWTVFC